MWHAWERREKCKRFWSESPEERDHSEDQGVGGRMGSEWILGRLALGVWIGFDWLKIGTVGGDEPSGSCATELVREECSCIPVLYRCTLSKKKIILIQYHL
jgi:hypothetical protein